MTIIGGPTWRLQLVTFACTWDVFATSSFNIGLPTYFVAHYFCERALYAVFCWRFCFKKSRAKLFDSGVANIMSKVTHVGVHAWCWHHVFVLLVQFALVILTVWLRLSLTSLSFKNTTIHINLLPGVFCFLRLMFAFIQALHRLSSLSDILVLHDSNRDFHA